MTRQRGTLVVARNVDNLLTTVRIGDGGGTARTVAERTYCGADVPTTVARRGGRLLVVNSQFDTLFGGQPLTSERFTVATLPRGAVVRP